MLMFLLFLSVSPVLGVQLQKWAPGLWPSGRGIVPAEAVNASMTSSMTSSTGPIIGETMTRSRVSNGRTTVMTPTRAINESTGSGGISNINNPRYNPNRSRTTLMQMDRSYVDGIPENDQNRSMMQMFKKFTKEGVYISKQGRSAESVVEENRLLVYFETQERRLPFGSLPNDPWLKPIKSVLEACTEPAHLSSRPKGIAKTLEAEGEKEKGTPKAQTVTETGTGAVDNTSKVGIVAPERTYTAATGEQPALSFLEATVAGTTQLKKVSDLAPTEIDPVMFDYIVPEKSEEKYPLSQEEFDFYTEPQCFVIKSLHENMESGMIIVIDKDGRIRAAKEPYGNSYIEDDEELAAFVAREHEAIQALVDERDAAAEDTLVIKFHNIPNRQTFAVDTSRLELYKVDLPVLYDVDTNYSLKYLPGENYASSPSWNVGTIGASKALARTHYSAKENNNPQYTRSIEKEVQFGDIQIDMIKEAPVYLLPAPMFFKDPCEKCGLLIDKEFGVIRASGILIDEFEKKWNLINQEGVITSEMDPTKLEKFDSTMAYAIHEATREGPPGKGTTGGVNYYGLARHARGNTNANTPIVAHKSIEAAVNKVNGAPQINQQSTAPEAVTKTTIVVETVGEILFPDEKSFTVMNGCSYGSQGSYYRHFDPSFDENNVYYIRVATPEDRTHNEFIVACQKQVLDYDDTSKRQAGQEEHNTFDYKTKIFDPLADRDSESQQISVLMPKQEELKMHYVNVSGKMGAVTRRGFHDVKYHVTQKGVVMLLTNIKKKETTAVVSKLETVVVYIGVMAEDRYGLLSERKDSYWLSKQVLTDATYHDGWDPQLFEKVGDQVATLKKVSTQAQSENEHAKQPKGERLFIDGSIQQPFPFDNGVVLNRFPDEHDVELVYCNEEGVILTTARFKKKDEFGKGTGDLPRFLDNTEVLVRISQVEERDMGRMALEGCGGFAGFEFKMQIIQFLMEVITYWRFMCGHPLSLDVFTNKLLPQLEMPLGDDQSQKKSEQEEESNNLSEMFGDQMGMLAHFLIFFIVLSTWSEYICGSLFSVLKLLFGHSFRIYLHKLQFESTMLQCRYTACIYQTVCLKIGIAAPKFAEDDEIKGVCSSILAYHYRYCLLDNASVIFITSYFWFRYIFANEDFTKLGTTSGSNNKSTSYLYVDDTTSNAKNSNHKPEKAFRSVARKYHWDVVFASYVMIDYLKASVFLVLFGSKSWCATTMKSEFFGTFQLSDIPVFAKLSLPKGRTGFYVCQIVFVMLFFGVTTFLSVVYSIMPSRRSLMSSFFGDQGTAGSEGDALILHESVLKGVVNTPLFPLYGGDAAEITGFVENLLNRFGVAIDCICIAAISILLTLSYKQRKLDFLVIIVLFMMLAFGLYKFTWLLRQKVPLAILASGFLVFLLYNFITGDEKKEGEEKTQKGGEITNKWVRILIACIPIVYMLAIHFGFIDDGLAEIVRNHVPGKWCGKFPIKIVMLLLFLILISSGISFGLVYEGNVERRNRYRVVIEDTMKASSLAMFILLQIDYAISHKVFSQNISDIPWFLLISLSMDVLACGYCTKIFLCCCHQTTGGLIEIEPCKWLKRSSSKHEEKSVSELASLLLGVPMISDNASRLLSDPTGSVSSSSQSNLQEVTSGHEDGGARSESAVLCRLKKACSCCKCCPCPNSCVEVKFTSATPFCTEKSVNGSQIFKERMFMRQPVVPMMLILLQLFFFAYQGHASMVLFYIFVGMDILAWVNCPSTLASLMGSEDPDKPVSISDESNEGTKKAVGAFCTGSTSTPK